MIRRKPLLVMLFVIAAAVLLQGIGITYADTGTAGERLVHPYAIRDPKIDQNLSRAQRARVQKEAVIKKRHASKKFVRDYAEGKAASDSKGKGVAK